MQLSRQKYRQTWWAAVLSTALLIVLIGVLIFRLASTGGRVDNVLTPSTALLDALLATFFVVRMIRAARRVAVELQKAASDSSSDIRSLSCDHYAGSAVILELQSDERSRASGWYLDLLLERYFDRAVQNRLVYDVLSACRSESGWLLAAIVRVHGGDAYSVYRSVAGIHRSALESDRFPAVAAQVSVLPVVGDDDIHIDHNDIEVSLVEAPSTERRHRNAFESTVRVTHLPSGRVIVCNGIGTPSAKRAGAIDVIRAELYAARELEPSMPGRQG